MSSELNFNDKKDDIEKIVRPIIQNYLEEEKEYNQDNAREASKKLPNQIIEAITEEIKDFKIFCSLIILEKGRSSLHLGQTGFWNTNTDTSVTIKEENDAMNCLAIIVGVSPN